MTEKILNIIHKKLSDGFQTNFLSPNEFESLYSKHFSTLLDELNTLTKRYYKLKHSDNKDESSEVIKIYKEDYIIKSFNNERRGYYSQDKYTIENLKELKETNEDSYNEYSEHYENFFSNDDVYGDRCVVSFMTYIQTKVKENISAFEADEELSINKLFWNDLLNSIRARENKVEKDELINSPEKILEKFKINYLSKDFLQLLSITDKQINDIPLSGLESFIINIGERNYVTERSGWTTNNFQVLNNSNKYKFSTSTKDESKIEGKFITIFILQLNKRHLLKISVTIHETEQTPYIIYRDFEKVSLKNECEILISKHHGNETIIFDSKKEALEFQAKVLELKEGKSNNFRKN